MKAANCSVKKTLSKKKKGYEEIYVGLIVVARREKARTAESLGGSARLIRKLVIERENVIDYYERAQFDLGLWRHILRPLELCLSRTSVR